MSSETTSVSVMSQALREIATTFPSDFGAGFDVDHWKRDMATAGLTGNLVEIDALISVKLFHQQRTVPIKR